MLYGIVLLLLHSGIPFGPCYVISYMPLNPQNVLKGKTLESVIITLFKRARFTVVPLGIEHLFPDIDALTLQEYKAVLPVGLRRLPDLMVYKLGDKGPNVQFVEVKFRSKLTPDTITKLKSALSAQFELWPEAICVLAIGEHPRYVGDNVKEYHHRYIGIIKPDMLDTLPDNPIKFWSALPALDSEFSEFNSNWSKNPLYTEIGAEGVAEMQALADDTVKIIRALAAIEPR